MGERTILVCDVCGKPAVQTVTIKVGRQNWTKDLCLAHVDELTAGARKPRPGRRRGIIDPTTGAPKRRGRPPKSGSGGAAATEPQPRTRLAAVASQESAA